MPVSVQWAIHNRVIYIKQWGIIHLEDMLETDQAIADSVAVSKNPHLHGIIDKLEVESFEADPKAIRIAFTGRAKPTDGWVVAVHHTRFSAFLSQLMAQSQQMKTWTFHDLPSAIAFLEEQDENLTHQIWDLALEHRPELS